MNHNLPLHKNIDKIIIKKRYNIISNDDDNDWEKNGIFKSFMVLYNTDGYGVWIIFLGEGELNGSIWYYGINNLGEYEIKKQYDTFSEFLCREVCPECVIEE